MNRRKEKCFGSTLADAAAVARVFVAFCVPFEHKSKNGKGILSRFFISIALCASVEVPTGER